MDFLFSQRLHLIFQLGYECQILNEIFDFDALFLDDPRLILNRGTGLRIMGNPVGIAQNHRQRRAEIVRHATDPVRACFVLPMDQFGRLIDGSRDGRQLAAGGKRSALTSRKCI